MDQKSFIIIIDYNWLSLSQQINTLIIGLFFSRLQILSTNLEKKNQVKQLLSMRRSSDQEINSYYTVEVNEHGLHIQVISATGTFIGLIRSLEMIDSLSSFNDLENLKKYIEDRENIEIYLQKPCLEILKKVRSRFIIMAQIPLKRKNSLTKKPFQRPNSIFKIMQELNSSHREFKEQIQSQEKFHSQVIQTKLLMRIMRVKQFQMDRLLEKLKYQISCIEGYKKAEEWVDPQSYCFKYLKFVGNRIINNTSRSISLFGNIDLRKKNSFTVQIKKMDCKIRIGLANQSDLKKEYLTNVKNKVYIINKQQKDSEFNQIDLKEGKGFKVGDRITVQIDFSLSAIQWKVGIQLVAGTIFDKLEDKSITWVPFISLCSQQDEVAII